MSNISDLSYGGWPDEKGWGACNLGVWGGGGGQGSGKYKLSRKISFFIDFVHSNYDNSRQNSVFKFVCKIKFCFWYSNHHYKAFSK